MEDSELCIWPAHIALTPSFSGVGRKTLNEDPSNVLAEQLAMDHCTQGFEVVQEMSETELVITSCGSMIPGTPDGGFTDSAGLLRLVQVVRVPLLPGMDAQEVADTLYDTVLAKIVKSQAWMRQTGILPHDFIIFCWLPPVGSYKVCLEQSDELLWTESLISNVRSGGWPFSLRVEVPIDPGGIFPTGFGQIHRERKSFFDRLCYFLSPSDFESPDDDEVMEWYLFDEDIDDTTDNSMLDEDVIGDQATDLRALIALAIHILEHAGEAQHCENVDVSLEARSEDHCATPQLHNACLVPLHGTDPGQRGAREKLSHLTPLIQGLPWWESESVVGGLSLGQRAAREKPSHVPHLIKGFPWLDLESVIEAKGCSWQTQYGVPEEENPPMQFPTMHNVMAMFDLYRGGYRSKCKRQGDTMALLMIRDHPLEHVLMRQTTRNKKSAARWIPPCTERTLSRADLKQRLTVSGKSCHHELRLAFKAVLLCFNCAA